MNVKLILVVLLSLSTTGCVAAIPLVAQMASAGTSAAQLCSMTKIPGQTTSLCDRILMPTYTQALGQPNTTAAPR
jgi:hypothetical protein